MRLFIAVDPDPATRDALAAAQRALREAAGPARWTDVAGAHVTLHFLGEVDPGPAAAIDAALARVAAATAPFALTLAGAGAFPSAARPRVLWAGLGGDVVALGALRSRIGEGLVALGHPIEARAFRPHLTLARDPADPRAAARAIATLAVPGSAWSVPDVVLYASRPGGGGPRYEVIGRHAFEAGGEPRFSDRPEK